MGTGASRTVFAPVSHQKARISFELHGCVTWMSMPRTALEPLDSSWQPARFVVIDDRRLQVNLVDHRSLASCSLYNLGSGQQVAAGTRRRGGATRIGVLTRFRLVGGRLCVRYDSGRDSLETDCMPACHRRKTPQPCRNRNTAAPCQTTRPFRDCKVMIVYVVGSKMYASTVSCWPSARAVSPQANTLAARAAAPGAHRAAAEPWQGAATPWHWSQLG